MSDNIDPREAQKRLIAMVSVFLSLPIVSRDISLLFFSLCFGPSPLQSHTSVGGQHSLVAWGHLHTYGRAAKARCLSSLPSLILTLCMITKGSS